MIGTERLVSAIRQHAQYASKRTHTSSRVGLVSSYDPKKHAVKVQLQPQGTLTGWIPLPQPMMGNNFGVLFAPNIKDQVILELQEGDINCCRVTGRHFSQKADQPPEIQAGEYLMAHTLGQQLYMDKKGKVTIGGANTWPSKQIGQGQSGNLVTGPGSGQGQSNDPNKQGQMQQQQKPNAGQTMVFDEKGTITTTCPNGNNVDKAKSVQTTATDKGGISETAEKGDITQTSKQGNITDKANTIIHNGVTNLNGNTTGTTGSFTGALGAGSFPLISDGRVKDRIAPMCNALQRAMKVLVRTYTVYEHKITKSGIRRKRRTGRQSFGVVAQEVQRVLPELVSSTDEVLKVEESKLGVLALAALQEYVKETDIVIHKLQQRIDKLEARLAR